MSAMVMGPAMPSKVSITVSTRTSNRASSSSAGRRATSSSRSPLGAPAARVAPARTAPAVQAAPAVSHLRLTARGRAVLWLLAASVAAVITLLGSQASADGPVAAQEVVRHVVQPGETLWQIAESVAAPSQDVRDVVVDLVALNELPEAGLMAGQVIVVPAG